MNPWARAGTMSDADIHAFGPPQGDTAAPAAATAAPRRRRWPWLLAAALLLMLLAAVVIVAGVLRELTLLAVPGWDVVVDGERVWPGEDFGLGTIALGLLGAVLAALVFLVVVLVVVPLALLLALFGVALGLGLPLLLLLGVLALLLSPLWLAGLLLWLLLRRSRRKGAEATIAA